MLVPLKFEAIALVVVQAKLALVGAPNNAKSKMAGKITREIRYRESRVRNRSLSRVLSLIDVWMKF